MPRLHFNTAPGRVAYKTERQPVRNGSKGEFILQTQIFLF